MVGEQTKKILLEEEGERASNYLRIFLFFLFCLGTFMSYLNKSEVYRIIEFYIVGIFIYGLSFITSFDLWRPSENS
jgi:sugar phosphate permease